MGSGEQRPLRRFSSLIDMLSGMHLKGRMYVPRSFFFCKIPISALWFTAWEPGAARGAQLPVGTARTRGWKEGADLARALPASCCCAPQHEARTRRYSEVARG